MRTKVAWSDKTTNELLGLHAKKEYTVYDVKLVVSGSIMLWGGSSYKGDWKLNGDKFVFIYLLPCGNTNTELTPNIKAQPQQKAVDEIFFIWLSQSQAISPNGNHWQIVKMKFTNILQQFPVSFLYWENKNNRQSMWELYSYAAVIATKDSSTNY